MYVVTDMSPAPLPPGTNLRLDRLAVRVQLDSHDAVTHDYRFAVLDGPFAGTCWWATAAFERDGIQPEQVGAWMSGDPVKPLDRVAADLTDLGPDDPIAFTIVCPTTGRTVPTGIRLNAVEHWDVAFVALGGSGDPVLRVCPACGAAHRWTLSGATVVPAQPD